MKRVTLTIIVLLIALAVSSLFLVMRYDSGYFADLISGMVTQKTGSPVQFAGKPSLTLMPLGLEFGNIQWQKEVLGSAGELQNIQISADGGFVALAASQFVFGKISLRDARVDNLRIEIVESSDNRQKGNDKQARSSTKESQILRLSQNDKDTDFPLEIARLHVRHGTFIHHATNGTQTRLGGVTMILENLSDKGNAGLHCNFDCTVEEKNGKIVLAGDIRIDGKLQFEHPRLSFLDSVAMFVPQIGPLPVKAGPLRLDFAGNHDFSTNRLHIQDLTLSLGLSGVKGGKVSARGQAVADFSSSEYTVKAVAGGLPVGALFEAFGHGHQFDATGSVDVDLTARGLDSIAFLSSLEGRGQVELRGITAVHSKNKLLTRANQIALPLPDRIDRMYAPFVVHKGELLARPVTMSGNGFSGNGNAKLNLLRQNIAANMDCKFIGVTIPVYAKGSFSNLQWGIDQDFATKLPSKLSDVLSGTGIKAGDAGSILLRKSQKAEGILDKMQRR